jgi:hypothetical protein
MIDKNGKIFGLINAFDFLAALAVVAAAGFLLLRKPDVAATAAVNTDKLIKISVYAEDVATFVGDSIIVGDRLEDADKDVYMGKITILDLREGYAYVNDAEGIVHKSVKEDSYSITVTAEVMAQVTETGVVLAGNKYGVGHSLTVRAGKGKFYGKVSEIEILG